MSGICEGEKSKAEHKENVDNLRKDEIFQSFPNASEFEFSEKIFCFL